MDPARLQEVLAALVARRIEESLARVEGVLAAWRRGENESMDAHAETLRHAARAGALSARVARAGIDGPEALLRDALEAGVIDEAEFRAATGKAPADVAAPPPLDDDAAGDAAHAMPAKKGVVDKLLQDGPVLIHLDARREDVDVPLAHRSDSRLVLRVGYGLTPPIVDLRIDDGGVHATLSFRGRPHICDVPWAAIYAVVAEDGRGLVWPEDVPPEVAKDFAREAGGPAAKDAAPSPAPAESPNAPKAPEGDGDGSKPKRGHLKLV